MESSLTSAQVQESRVHHIPSNRRMLRLKTGKRLGDDEVVPGQRKERHGAVLLKSLSKCTRATRSAHLLTRHHHTRRKCTLVLSLKATYLN
jgi:hypothetical protein